MHAPENPSTEPAPETDSDDAREHVLAPLAPVVVRVVRDRPAVPGELDHRPGLGRQHLDRRDAAVRRHPGDRRDRADPRRHAAGHRPLAGGDDDPLRARREQVRLEHGNNIVLAIVVVAAMAVVVGLVNGLVVSFFNVTPLVATLAMNAILMGVALAYSGGTPVRAPDKVSDSRWTRRSVSPTRTSSRCSW